MKDIAEMNYSEFCEYLNGEGYDRFEPVLSYDEFAVYLDRETGRYYYLEGGENDADEFYEVELVATLFYNVNNDIRLERGETLDYLFDCCVCGEYITDDNIQYRWFKRKETKEDDGL